MPIELAEVDWLYVVVLAVFAFVATYVGNLLSFGRHGIGAILSAVLFAAIYVGWTYYPHRLPWPPTAPASQKVPAAAVAPAAPAAPTVPQRPRNPITDITPPATPQ
jgi:1,4-dihydroxy-2-naphthoate octaprenyltransferase